MTELAVSSGGCQVISPAARAAAEMPVGEPGGEPRSGQRGHPAARVAASVSACALRNSHRFASRCARWRLPRTGWLAADAGGSFEAVAVDVAGEVADEPGVLHAEGGGRELGIEVGDELGDASLAAERRGGARGPERPGEVALVSWAVAGARGAGDD